MKLSADVKELRPGTAIWEWTDRRAECRLYAPPKISGSIKMEVEFDRSCATFDNEVLMFREFNRVLESKSTCISLIAYSCSNLYCCILLNCSYLFMCWSSEYLTLCIKQLPSQICLQIYSLFTRYSRSHKREYKHHYDRCEQYF